MISTSAEQAADDYLAAGSELLAVPGADGKVDLQAVLQILAERGCNEVLVEAGAGLSGAFWRAGLVDELIVYMAPRLLGSQARPLMQLPFESMSEAMDVAVTDMRAIGQDWRITARPIFPS